MIILLLGEYSLMETNPVYQLIPNPTDNERHEMTMKAFINEGRAYDYECVTELLSPPPDILNFGVPGEYKGIKIGIIGGGLAGLSAAFELRKLGFDITIFEAYKDHIGGRVYTHYFDKDKRLYGELGAMRFPAGHETTWHYINLFKLNTSPFIQYNPNTFAYIRGVRVKNTSSNITQKVYPLFSMTQAEQNTPWPELYNQVSQVILNSIPLNIRNELLQLLPEYSSQFKQWTRFSSRQVMYSYGLSSGAVDLITSMLPMVNAVLYNGYGEELIEQYELSFKNLYQLDGGTANLPLAFYNSLTSKDPKEYYNIPQNLLGTFTWKSGQWVTGIYKSDLNGKIILRSTDTFERIGVDESFDYVICALPLSELRKIDIKPSFRAKKMQAIKQIDYLDAQKTLFLCKDAFWEKGNTSEEINGGVSITDLLIQSIVYPSNTKHPSSNPIHNAHGESKSLMYTSRKPGVIIASYNLELDSVRLGTMNEEERFVLIKRQIEEVHGLPKGYLDDIIIDTKTIEWNSEFWFSGAFARFFPGQRIEFFYELSIPEYDNRVFFAGEHTSSNHAWMQGALYSGKSAANRIVYCIKHPYERKVPSTNQIL